MKKFILFFLVFITVFNLTGCFNNFEHKTIYYNPQSNGGNYSFEITVLEVSNDYMPNMWSRGLDATIEIKTIASAHLVDYSLKLYDFEFYITKKRTVYKTYMYIDSPAEEVQFTSLTPQTTKIIHLRIDYDKIGSISEPDITNEYVIKLWGIRI